MYIVTAILNIDDIVLNMHKYTGTTYISALSYSCHLLGPGTNDFYVASGSTVDVDFNEARFVQRFFPWYSVARQAFFITDDIDICT